jgi:tetratricopeptide (TPR) repeat protein
MDDSRVDRFRSGLVEIVRDFLIAHQLLNRLSKRFHTGELRFADVEDLVGDNDRAVLFRLKERCHSLFRVESRSSVVRSGELFDLAVGSLFHEAMKFRENVYQQEVYAPRVQRLRESGGREADDLLREFEKVLANSPERLAETLRETEGLFAQTRRQLRHLLVAHAANGLVARFLLERSDLVAEVFPEGVEELLTDVYGGSAKASSIAIHSYLESAHFEEALRAIDEVAAEAPAAEELARLAKYARGMQAFLARDYEASVRWLAEWVDATPSVREAPYAKLALSAISRIGKLLPEGDSASIEASAADLSRRIEAHAGGS